MLVKNFLDFSFLEMIIFSVNKIRTAIALFSLFSIISAFPAHARASEVAELCENLRRIDISCNMFDTKYRKKSCGAAHSRDFMKLINSNDKAAALAYVEEEKDRSKERLAALEKMSKSAKPSSKNRYLKLVKKAQGGDRRAIAELERIGPAAIPSILIYRDLEGVMPSPQLQSLTAGLERRGDEMLASGGAGLDAATIGAFVSREKNYIEILKRAVISLEGTRSKLPHWLPFVYAYAVGFIPFLCGIIASAIYYGGIKPRAVAVILFCYIFYFCLNGFFQFFAPYM